MANTTGRLFSIPSAPGNFGTNFWPKISQLENGEALAL
jgi:hypothetical protein